MVFKLLGVSFLVAGMSISTALAAKQCQTPHQVYELNKRSVQDLDFKKLTPEQVFTVHKMVKQATGEDGDFDMVYLASAKEYGQLNALIFFKKGCFQGWIPIDVDVAKLIVGQGV